MAGREARTIAAAVRLPAASILHSPPQAPAGAIRAGITRQPPGREVLLRQPARLSGPALPSLPAPLSLAGWRPSPSRPCPSRSRLQAPRAGAIARAGGGRGQPQDQHQGRREGQAAIDGRGHGLAAGMAVSRTQHLPAALPSPGLGQQLLAGINREPLSAFGRRLPDVATGPDAPDAPEGAIDQSQQQHAPFQRQLTAQIGLQNRQRPPTDPDLPWRVRVHSGKLPANPCASAPLHE